LRYDTLLEASRPSEVKGIKRISGLYKHSLEFKKRGNMGYFCLQYENKLDGKKEARGGVRAAPLRSRLRRRGSFLALATKRAGRSVRAKKHRITGLFTLRRQ
jgi:hypothetical protein